MTAASADRADRGCQLCWAEDGTARVAGFRIGAACRARLQRIAAADGVELIEQGKEIIARRVGAPRHRGRTPRVART